MKNSTKKNNMTKKIVLQVMKQNLTQAIGLIGVVIAVVLLSLIPPQLLKTIIDKNLVTKDLNGLSKLVMIYLSVLILIGIFDFIKGGLLTVFGQKIIKNIRVELTYKLERLNTGYFSTHTPGTISSRLLNDVENVNALFADGVISMVIDCLKIIGIVVSVWLFSSKLGFIVLCLIPLIASVTRAFQRRMLKAQVKNLEQLGKVNAHISESLKNVHMIKSFSKEAFMEDVYKQKLEDNFHTIEKVNFYDSVYAPLIQIIRALVISLIIYLAASQLNFLGISLGMVAASIELISNLFSPIEALGMELQNVQKGLSGVKRVNSFYLEPEEPPKQDSYTAQAILESSPEIELIFDQVSFGYDAGQPVLENLKFEIKHGSSVTFIGRTGVGKTTLFRLVMGLLQPTSGKVLLGSYDVYDIPNREKRKLFGYVEQQFSFIRGSVADQISLGDASISQTQVEEAIQFVGLHDYVMAMESGYNTVVGPQGDFSQGQKQLLTIARAIVSNPAVLLLDEVTANLDSVTEKQIVTVLQKAKQGRTVLSISHRMTAMLESDMIVVLEAGRIRAAGKPEDILKTDDWISRKLHLEESTWES